MAICTWWAQGVYGYGPRSGVHLGTIVVPEQPANLAWGDPDYSTLYITATTSVYRVKTRAHGFIPYLQSALISRRRNDRSIQAQSVISYLLFILAFGLNLVAQDSGFKVIQPQALQLPIRSIVLAFWPATRSTYLVREAASPMARVHRYSPNKSRKPLTTFRLC